MRGLTSIPGAAQQQTSSWEGRPDSHKGRAPRKAWEGEGSKAEGRRKEEGGYLHSGFRAPSEWVAQGFCLSLKLSPVFTGIVNTGVAVDHLGLEYLKEAAHRLLYDSSPIRPQVTSRDS